MIAAATALLRDGGPHALTSVNVAAQLGLTQPAIYRHIRNMGELTTLASHAVVGELSAILTTAVMSPDTTWGDGSHLQKFADQIVRTMAEHRQAFAAIDHWRYEDNELGEGIRALLDAGAHLIASEFEPAWRGNFQYDTPFDESTSAVQLAHAGLMVDDVVAIARSVDSAEPARLDVAARTLAMRFFADWCSYVLEINTRLGMAIPRLGSSALSAPQYVTA